MKIIGDNQAILKNFILLKNMIEEWGGTIDPELVVRCEGANIGIEKHGFSTPGKPIIALPNELLLPSEHMGMSVKGDEFDYAPEAGAFSDAQKKAADCMIEIYNLTKKVPAHKESCCWLAFKEAPELLEKLLKARTLNPAQQKYLAFAKDNLKDSVYEEIVCGTYIKSRAIGHKHTRPDSDEIVQTTDIMPMIDFLNHHSSGAYFNFNKNYTPTAPEREFLLVQDSRPLSFSNECFVFYNQMDALDTFMLYGFPDAHAPYVRSLPLELEIPNTGKILVRSLLGIMHKGVLPKNAAGLRPYIPSTIGNEGDVLEISNLLIPTNSGTPHALRRVLRLLMTNRAAQKRTLNTSQIWDAVLAAEEKILDANIRFYRNLLADMDAEARNASPQKIKLIGTVKTVAGLQLTKLYKYSFDQSATDTTAREQEIGKVAAAE